MEAARRSGASGHPRRDDEQSRLCAGFSASALLHIYGPSEDAECVAERRRWKSIQKGVFSGHNESVTAPITAKDRVYQVVAGEAPISAGLVPTPARL
jgi:hypothetical protein